MIPTEVLISGIIIMIFLIIMGFIGCISSYNDGYKKGYDDSYYDRDKRHKDYDDE